MLDNVNNRLFTHSRHYRDTTEYVASDDSSLLRRSSDGRCHASINAKRYSNGKYYLRTVHGISNASK